MLQAKRVNLLLKSNYNIWRGIKSLLIRVDGNRGQCVKRHFRICNEPVSIIAPMKSIKGADFVFSEDMNDVPFMGYWLSVDPQRARRFTGDDFDD